MKIDERMKKYEYVTRNHLAIRTPVVVRIDGKAFHTFTKGGFPLMMNFWQERWKKHCCTFVKMFRTAF